MEAGLKEKIKDCSVQDTERFWCSALVAYLYKCWGFIPNDTPFTIITCKSLGTESGRQIKLHFENCTLDPEVRLK